MSERCAVLSVALGRYAGEGQGELSLMRALDGGFDAGDVVLCKHLAGHA